MKSIAKNLAVLNTLALVVTAAIALFLGKSAAPDLLDVAMYVGLGVIAAGVLMFVGATSGSNGSAELGASAADRPSKLMEALWMDRDAGISTGALFVLGGATWLALAWLLAVLLGG